MFKFIQDGIDWVEAKWFPKRFNVRFCDHDWSPYFNVAEPHMDMQWEEIIWPQIKDANFESVLELAPGAGRNTAKLVGVAQQVQAVDINDKALELLRNRFKDYAGPCRLSIHKGDGTSLKMIPTGSITFIYCWDAAVHFEKNVMRAYIAEFSRIMKPGAIAFIHHSNLGEEAAVDLRKNIRWRSNVNKEIFAEYCQENQLEILRQIIVPWGLPINGRIIDDCISIFKKPDSSASSAPA